MGLTDTPLQFGQLDSSLVCIGICEDFLFDTESSLYKYDHDYKQ